MQYTPPLLVPSRELGTMDEFISEGDDSGDDDVFAVSATMGVLDDIDDLDVLDAAFATKPVASITSTTQINEVNAAPTLSIGEYLTGDDYESDDSDEAFAGEEQQIVPASSGDFLGLVAQQQQREQRQQQSHIAKAHKYGHVVMTNQHNSMATQEWTSDAQEDLAGEVQRIMEDIHQHNPEEDMVNGIYVYPTTLMGVRDTRVQNLEPNMAGYTIIANGNLPQLIAVALMGRVVLTRVFLEIDHIPGYTKDVELQKRLTKGIEEWTRFGLAKRYKAEREALIARIQELQREDILESAHIPHSPRRVVLTTQTHTSDVGEGRKFGLLIDLVDYVASTSMLPLGIKLHAPLSDMHQDTTSRETVLSRAYTHALDFARSAGFLGTAPPRRATVHIESFISEYNEGDGPRYAIHNNVYTQGNSRGHGGAHAIIEYPLVLGLQNVVQVSMDRAKRNAEFGDTFPLCTIPYTKQTEELVFKEQVGERVHTKYFNYRVYPREQTFPRSSSSDKAGSIISHMNNRDSFSTSWHIQIAQWIYGLDPVELTPDEIVLFAGSKTPLPIPWRNDQARARFFAMLNDTMMDQNMSPAQKVHRIHSLFLEAGHQWFPSWIFLEDAAGKTPGRIQSAE